MLRYKLSLEICVTERKLCGLCSAIIQAYVVVSGQTYSAVALDGSFRDEFVGLVDPALCHGYFL